MNAGDFAIEFSRAYSDSGATKLQAAIALTHWLDGISAPARLAHISTIAAMKAYKQVEA